MILLHRQIQNDGVKSLVPFTMQTVLQQAVVTLLPVGPRQLTMIPLEELVERLLKSVF